MCIQAYMQVDVSVCTEGPVRTCVCVCVRVRTCACMLGADSCVGDRMWDTIVHLCQLLLELGSKCYKQSS